jgi:hypothetical protein
MYSKIHKYLLFLSTFMFLFSCGKSTEQIIIDAIESAEIHLSKRECQKAIDLLNNVGIQNTNARYLKALSSGYACRAGYSTTVFFGTDVALTATPSPLGGMTTYSTSLVTTTSPLSDDSKFRDLQTAIDILLYAGGISSTTEPTTSERAKYFSGNVAGDINSQLTFMLLAQVGKFMKVYGDTNASGVKGGGSEGNNCFTDYSATDPATVQLYITSGVGTGACTSLASSHPELAVGATDRRKRMCEGVILLNNILELLPSVLATAGGGDLGTIATMDDQIQELKDDLVDYDPTFARTATVLSQANCETDSDIDLVTLSSYYAVFFESLVL